jgi:hypothetical protein
MVASVSYCPLPSVLAGLAGLSDLSDSHCHSLPSVLHFWGRLIVVLHVVACTGLGGRTDLDPLSLVHLEVKSYLSPRRAWRKASLLQAEHSPDQCLQMMLLNLPYSEMVGSLVMV